MTSFDRQVLMFRTNLRFRFHVEDLSRMCGKTFCSVTRCSFSAQSNILVNFFPYFQFVFFFFTFLQLATGRTVRGSNPDGARFFAPDQTGPGAHLFSYTSVSHPLWDHGPVNSIFIRRGPGPNKFTRKYLSNLF